MQITFCDIHQNKIIGATPGTATWHHEEGHLIYNRSEKGMKNDFHRQSFFNATIFFLVVSLFIEIGKWFALFAMLMTVWFTVREELWCWKYAFKKMKKNRLYKK